MPGSRYGDFAIRRWSLFSFGESGGPSQPDETSLRVKTATQSVTVEKVKL
jgi:hypothetical protein